MNNREKLDLMDKVMRELADLKTSQVALINKAAKLQVDNMELTDQELDEKFGEIHNQPSESIDTLTEVAINFEERRRPEQRRVGKAGSRTFEPRGSRVS